MSPLGQPSGQVRESPALAPNIAANLAGQFVLLVLSLVAVKLVFGRLGQDALGIVLFVQTVNVVLAGVLDLGVSSVTVREVAAHSHDDPAYVRMLVRTASTVYWAGFALVAVATVLVAPWLARHWVNLGAMDPGTATAVLRILGVAALSALPRALYVSLYRGLQKTAYNNAIDVATGLVQQLGTVVILSRGGGLLAVVWWLATGYAAGLGVYIVTLSRFIPLRALIPGWSGPVVRRNARFSAHMMSISALGVLHTYLDKLVMSKLLPIAALGSYTSASSLVARGTLLTNAIAEAAYPSLSALHHRHDAVAMLRQYRKLQDLVCFGTVPLYAALIFISPPLLGTLFGAHVAQQLLFPVAVLCLGYYLNGTLTVPYVYSLAVGKPHITSRITFQAVFIIVPVTVGSVALLGVTGAGIGYLAYHLFIYLVGVPQYCRQCLGIPTRTWYRHAATVLSLGAATYGIGFLLAARFGGLRLVALAAMFVLASMLFIAAAFRLVDPDLRALLLGRLGRRQGTAARAA